jgi:hypothetical protein
MLLVKVTERYYSTLVRLFNNRISHLLSQSLLKVLISPNIGKFHKSSCFSYIFFAFLYKFAS